MSEGYDPTFEWAREAERLICPDINFDKVIIVNGRRMTIEEYNNSGRQATNGDRCPFCGDLFHRSPHGWCCHSCSPETERVKLIKSMRKTVKMVVKIK